MAVEQLVSVIIPLYNAEKYLEGCIGSILGQTYPEIEIIVIDDGSTDNSLAMAKKFERSNLKVFTQKNSGASVARNHGLKIAKGKYIQFMDADDLIDQDKIAGQVEILEKNPDFIAVCATSYFRDGTDPFKVQPVKEWYNLGSDDPVDFLLKLYSSKNILPGFGGMIQPNAWLTPRNIIDVAGPWNEFRCPDDDGEFFCRVILASKGVKFSERGVNYYRKFNQQGSLSGQKTREAFENIFIANDLKYSHLRERTDSAILDQTFAEHYWILGVASYPKFKDISARAIKKAKKYGYRGPKYVSSKLATYFSRIIGWRLVRAISYLKHGF